MKRYQGTSHAVWSAYLCKGQRRVRDAGTYESDMPLLYSRPQNLLAGYLNFMLSRLQQDSKDMLGEYQVSC